MKKQIKPKFSFDNKSTICRGLISIILYNLKKAQTNCEEGTFASIEIDRKLVQEEIEITCKILSKNKKMMSTTLDNYIEYFLAKDFTILVDEIVDKMMTGEVGSECTFVYSELGYDEQDDQDDGEDNERYKSEVS